MLRLDRATRPPTTRSPPWLLVQQQRPPDATRLLLIASSFLLLTVALCHAACSRPRLLCQLPPAFPVTTADWQLGLKPLRGTQLRLSADGAPLLLTAAVHRYSATCHPTITWDAPAPVGCSRYAVPGSNCLITWLINHSIFNK